MSCEREQAAFLGRMTAAATHELRNLLAIIRESAGLIGDSIGGAAATKATPERLQRSVDRIERQVVRGTDLLGNLNHLAHCPDQAEVIVDLNREVECMVKLGLRLAHQHSIVLQLTRAEVEVPVLLDPLRLHMVLLATIELLIEPCTGGGTITARVAAGLRPVVELVTDGEIPGAESSESWQRLRRLAAGLPASVEQDRQGRLRILFTRG